eukprot:3357100-Amphidinium_carterae.1
MEFQFQQAELLQLLSTATLPLTRSRTNVAQENGAPAGRGMWMGLKTARGVGVHKLSPTGTRILETIHRLAEVANITDYTSAGVQQHSGLRPHRDRANCKPSYLLALGSYTGGRLRVAQDGDVAPAEEFNTYGKWLRFDSTGEHSVTPVHGTRYSVALHTGHALARSRRRYGTSCAFRALDHPWTSRGQTSSGLARE